MTSGTLGLWFWYYVQKYWKSCYILVLASNMCFNVETGQFNTRSDLSDAPTCALGRGAPLQGLGKHQSTSCSSDINVHLVGT